MGNGATSVHMMDMGKLLYIRIKKTFANEHKNKNVGKPL